MQRPTPGGEVDTEAGGRNELLRLRPTNPKSRSTLADETENLPEWKRIGMKYRYWIIIAVLVIIIIILAISLAVVVASDNKISESGGTNTSTSTKENVTYFTHGYLVSAARTKASINPNGVPCDDFYEFACGGFVASTILVDDGGSRSLRNVISEQYQQRLSLVLRERGGPDNFGAFEIAKNLYKTCMDINAIETAGLEPLRKLLRQLGRWPLLEDNWTEDSFDWLESISRVRKLGYVDGYFIGFGVDTESETRSSNVIVLDKATLSIPSAHLVLGMENEKVKAYFAYMIDIAVALGFDRARATQALTGALKLEIKLANITLADEKRQKTNDSGILITISDMNNRYPGVNWEEFINDLLPSEVRVNGDERLLVLAPSYFSGITDVISSTSKTDQANYAMWRLIGSSIRYFTESVTRKYAQFQAKINPHYKSKPRPQECVDIVVEKMPISIGALYARKYLKDKDVKKTATEVVANVKTAFDEILEKADWMDKETKDTALKRAVEMTSYVAYPDEYLDNQSIYDYYKELEVNSEDLIGYVLTLAIFKTRKSLGQLRKPVKEDDWTIRPFSTEANVVYDFINNDLQIPAGILQGGYFDPDRPQSMNYGALGALIGHELTRGFDDIGKPADWWTPEPKNNYSKETQCFIDQYSNYRVSSESLNVNLNGVSTRRENIADNVAIKEARLAYTEWAQKSGSDEAKLPGLDYTPAQLFWISAANVWCSKYDYDALVNVITTGVYSPGKYRVIGSFSNMPEFAADFNCSLGSPMNPVHKCTVW